MNNVNPFMYPYNFYPVDNYNQNEIDKIISKLERLEKDIRIINNKLSKLDNIYKTNNNTINDTSNDMYII